MRHIIRVPIHSNKAKRKDDNDDQKIFGDLVDLKFPDICLTGEENPEKTSPMKLVPTGDPTRARFVTGAHAMPVPQRWTLLGKFPEAKKMYKIFR